MLPAYYACLVLSLVICFTVTNRLPGMPFEQYLPVTWQNGLAHLFLIQNWSPTWMYKINGVLWSIAIEAQLYLLFPILVWLMFKTGRVAVTVLTAMAAAAILFGRPIWQAVSTGSVGLADAARNAQADPAALKLYPWYLALFAFGMVAAYTAFRPSLKFGVKPKLALLLAAACGLGAIQAVRTIQPIYVSDALMAGAVALILYSGLTRPGHWFMRALGCKPLAWLGLFSYSLYLIHHPVEQVLYYYRPAWANGEVGVFGYLAACLPAMILVAWVFWWFFERPFLRRPALYQSNLVQVPTRLPRAISTPTVPSGPVGRRGQMAPEALLEGAIEAAPGESETTPIEVHPLL